MVEQSTRPKRPAPTPAEAAKDKAEGDAAVIKTIDGAVAEMREGGAVPDAVIIYSKKGDDIMVATAGRLSDVADLERKASVELKQQIIMQVDGIAPGTN